MNEGICFSFLLFFCLFFFFIFEHRCHHIASNKINWRHLHIELTYSRVLSYRQLNANVILLHFLTPFNSMKYVIEKQIHFFILIQYVWACAEWSFSMQCVYRIEWGERLNDELKKIFSLSTQRWRLMYKT